MGRVQVGTASWADRRLLESGWYPPETDTPEKRLRYYARRFPLVEVDATYYGLAGRSYGMKRGLNCPAAGPSAATVGRPPG